MITKFKLFERAEDEDDLADQFSQEYIEKYYDMNYEIPTDDAVIWANLWNYVDKDSVKEGLIKEKVRENDLDEFNNEQLTNYILDNMKELLEPKMDRLIKKYELSDLEDILEAMPKKRIAHLIYDEDLSADFIKKYYEEEWEDKDVEEILMELHGKNAIENNEELYNYLFPYLNEESMIEDYKNSIQFEDKYEYLAYRICSDMDLQQKLIEMDSDNVFALFDIMENTTGEEYAFQKLYLDKIKEEDGNIAMAIKDIDERYGLNPKIEEEYKEYLYIINAEKYNI